MSSMDDDFPALLTPRQKRVARILLTTYLILTGIFTTLQGAYSVALFYGILIVVDFYLCTHIGHWVRIKKR